MVRNPDLTYPINEEGTFVLFWCTNCHRYTPTIQLHLGYIPDFIVCRATGTMDNGCGQRAYRVDPARHHEAPTEPEWEWYCPYRRSQIPATENRLVEYAVSKLLIIRKRGV